jgi:hypothetical protein
MVSIEIIDFFNSRQIVVGFTVDCCLIKLTITFIMLKKIKTYGLSHIQIPVDKKVISYGS